MRLHLPVKLFRALLACMAAVSFVSFTTATSTCFAATEEEEEENELRMLLSEPEYPNGSITYAEKLSSSLTLEGYKSILFKDISSSYDGGAMYSYDSTIFTLSGNGNVTFSGNTTSSHYSGASGGAIYNRGSNAPFTLSGNGDVTFSGNTASSSSSFGGAIYNYSSIFTLRENGNVTFSGNTASSSANYSSGGAICNNSGTITLNGNGDVTFSGNTATSSYSSYITYGGAIDNGGNNATFTLSDNGDVTFSGNTASSYASGGAIGNRGSNASFTLSDNGDVTFIGNTASSYSSYDASSGGAIYNRGSNATFTLSGNGAVTFSGNTVSSSSSAAYGGAIYNDGTFTLSGNGDVLFEKNAEVINGDYRLRSIYSIGTLNLSASEDKSILFKDSFYASGTVNLNQNGTGDIIFTGAYVEKDLQELKGEAATSAEIQRSQWSQFKTDVNLSGGSLLVQDGAKLTFDGLAVGASSQSASLQLQNGWVDVSVPLTLAAGSSLTFSGCNYLLSSGIVAEGDNALSLTIGEENRQFAALSVIGAIHGESVVIDLGDVSTLTGMNYHLLHVIGNAEGWETAEIRLTGASADALTWVNGDLYYRYDGSLPTPQTRKDRTTEERITVEEFELLSGYQSLTFAGASSGITNSDYTVILENESVTFSGNTASSSGGAIDNSSTFTLSGNGAVTFSGNTATSTTSSASGGAIDNSSTFTLSGNGAVTFSGNTATSTTSSASGGAIYNSGTFTLSDNGDVTFSENTATSRGGAIYNSCTFTLSGNGDVTFSENTATSTATSASGGAIGNRGSNASFSLSGNGAVTFSGNSVSDSASSSLASGGAIYNSCTFTLSGNGAVTFSGNAVSSSAFYNNAYAYGGAIDNEGTFTLNGNGDVTFSGNSVSTTTSTTTSSSFYNDAYAYGGAIYNDGTFTLNGNGDVTFSGNTVSTSTTSTTTSSSFSSYAYGGAIYNNAGTITLSENGDVTFSWNTVSASIDSSFFRDAYAYGGAIYNHGTFTLNGNGDVTFSGNTATTTSSSASSSAYGGAIYNSGTFTLSDNGDVTFSGNTATSRGGAIYNSCTFTLSGNGDVTFSGNTASFFSAYGGAIYNSGTFTLSDNGNVTFSGNTATSRGGAIYNSCTFTLSGNGDVTFSENNSDAIDNSGTFTLSENGDVTFSENNSHAIYNGGTFTLRGNGAVTFSGNSGGAIYNSGSNATITLSENGDVTFSGNKDSEGGAIYNSYNSTITLSRNGEVTFSGNTASSSSYAYGGAISNDGTFTLSGNSDVTFSGHTAAASSSSAAAYGGAISNSGTFTLSENGDVTFSGNTVSSSSSSSYVQGGAIYNKRTFTLSDNGAVTFSGNTASSYYYNDSTNVQGGAIYNSGTFTLSGNGDVTFSGNTAFSYHYSSFKVCGGAIYNSATFTMNGNGDVLFEKNAEIIKGNYRLRSIYSTGTLNLSAPAGKSILFRDSVYAEGTVNLNQDGSGDIIFTGATTETDLKDVKGGIDGTASEILNSRTSELATLTNLYGGRLIVENGAVLKGHGITAAADSGASVMVRNATLDARGYSLTFNAGTALEVEGAAVISASAVEMNSGSSLLFVLSAENKNTAALTLDGSFSLSASSSIIVDCRDAVFVGTYQLVSLANGGSLSEMNSNTINFRPNLFEQTSYWGEGTLMMDVEQITSVTWNPTGTDRSWDTTEKNWLGKKALHSFEDGIDVRFGNDGYGVVSLSGTLAPGCVIVENDIGKDYIFEGPGQLSGSMTLTKSGVGTLTLNIGHTYSGGTQMQGGTLVAGNASAFGTGAVTLSGGTLNLNGKAVANTVQVTGSAGITGGSCYAGTLMLMGGTLGGEALNLVQTADLQSGSVNSSFSGAGAVQKTTAGTVTLNAASTYSGGTLLREGTLVVKNLQALGTGAVNLAGGALNLNALNGTFSNALTGTGGFTVNNGTNSLTLSVENTFLGGITLQRGKLVAGNDAAFGRGAVTLAGGTLDMNRMAVNNTLAVTGTATLNNANRYTGQLVLDGGSLSGTALQLVKDATLYSGSIANNMTGRGGVIKEGTGTATLTGLNTYSGETVINKGTLKIAGLVTSNIRLNEAGTLNTGSGMTLTYNQKLTMAGGGIVGAFSTGAGSNLVVQQGANVSGSLTFGGGCVTLNNQGLDNTLRVSGTLNLSEKTELKLVGYDTAGAYVLATYGSLWGSLSNLDVTMAFPEGSRQMAALASASGYLVLTITGDATVLNWRGGSGEWETLGSAQWGADSWVDDKRFHAYDTVVFDRGGSLSINGTVLPKEVQVSGSADVSFSGSGSIGGESTLLKEGSCELTLNAANSYTGGSTLRGGSVKATGAQSFGTNRIWLQSGTLNLNEQAVRNAVTASGGSISGGSAYAGELTVDGRVSVSGSLTAGAVNLLSGTLTGGKLTDTTVYATAGSIESSFGGYSELVGNNYAMQSAVSNSGTLRLSGIFDLSGMTPEQSHTERVDLNGNTGTSGFTVSGSYNLRLVNGGKVDNGGAVFLYNGSELSLNANGTVGYAGETDYSTYYMQKSDTLASSAIHRMGAGAAVNMVGGTLTADDAVAVTAQGGTLRLQGGSITSGTLTDCTVNAVSGSIRADIIGNSSMTVSGNVRADGALQLNALTLQSGTLTADIATADVTKLTVGQGALDGALTLNGGSVIFGGNTLSVSGQLALVSSTALDVSAYTKDGTYTLIQAGSFTGNISEQLSIANESSRYSYTLSQVGNKLNLSVAVLSEEHTWTAAKGSIIAASFAEGDSLTIGNAATITISGELKQGGITVTAAKNVTLSSDKKTAGSRIGGEGTITKSGIGLLTLNAGNTYTGGTTLNAGTLKATAVDSFGTGDITVNGGTLDLGSKAVSNAIVLSGEATLKGDAKYTGNVTVEGDATLLAKTSYKGMTTIGAGSTLTLAPKATMAGSMTLDGGTLNISAPKGMTLAKNMTMLLNGGSVNGLLTIGTGSTLVWQDGTFDAASPVLKGGTLDLGGENALTLTGSKAQVAFGDKALQLPGKGAVRTDEALNVNSGTVTVNSMGGYEGEIVVNSGTLKLSTGKMTTENDIVVNGTAAVVNGGTHYGDITVDGLLAKGTNIKLLDGNQKVALNGEGAMLGTIAGAGTVDVNASIDATAAKLTAATINLNSGTFTNTKGIKLAKGQTLTLAGAALNLGPKGALATVAGSTLVVDRNTTLTGSLTLGGGELVFNNTTLELKDTATLTLSKAMTVTGSGTIHYTTLKAAKNVDVVKLFGEGAELDKEHCILTFNGGAAESSKASAPLATAAEAPAPLDAAPAIPVVNPVTDAMVQADWGIIDAERAFMGAVNNRSQHAALLDKGRGAAWVSAFGASVRHGNQGTHHGSDGNIEGAAFGLEHAVSDTGTLGLALGRSKNRLAATGVTHLRQETAHVALYGQKQLAHGFTADAAASYGDTETKLGSASWTQKSAALTARLTHAQKLPDATALAFRTFGGLAYEATDAGSIGSAHTGSVQNLRAEVGAGATHNAGKAHLYAEAALTGDIVRHNPTVDFGGARTHGANPGRLGLRATVGGIYEFTDTWSGTASYGIEAESRSTSHTLNIGVSKSF